MIINFLQCGVTPSVLPSLQLLQPEVFDSNIPETELTFHMPPPNFQSENSSSLGMYYPVENQPLIAKFNG